MDVPAIDFKELRSAEEGEPSATVRARVETARAVQAERFGNGATTLTNAAMPPKLVRAHCALDAEGNALLEQAMTELNFSARAHDRILKVARTIADLAGQPAIGAAQLLEAIQFRTLDRNLWA